MYELLPRPSGAWRKSILFTFNPEYFRVICNVIFQMSQAALIAQLVQQCRRLRFDSWVRKVRWRRDKLPTPVFLGFPGSSDGKESAYNAGDPDWIPGSGRSAGEGISYPLQYSWASLVAQLVKNPPVVQETCVWSLGWDDPLEKGKATHSSILAWVTKSQTWLSDFHFHIFSIVTDSKCLEVVLSG